MQYILAQMNKQPGVGGTELLCHYAAESEFPAPELPRQRGDEPVNRSFEYINNFEM